MHLTANDPLRFVPQLAEAGATLVFLPAETTPFLYEAIYALREHDLRAGVCLALGTPLEVLTPVLPLVDAVLLLGRVTGEGARGRAFNRLVLDRIGAVRETLGRLQAQGHDVAAVDLQAAGGLEVESSVEACRRGVTSLPLGSALHREPDLRAFVATLRDRLAGAVPDLDPDPVPPRTGSAPPARAAAHRTPRFRVLVASRSFGPNCPAAVERLRAAGCELVPNDLGRAPTEAELAARIGDVDALISGTEPVTAAVLAGRPPAESDRQARGGVRQRRPGGRRRSGHTGLRRRRSDHRFGRRPRARPAAGPRPGRAPRRPRRPRRGLAPAGRPRAARAHARPGRPGPDRARRLPAPPASGCACWRTISTPTRPSPAPGAYATSPWTSCSAPPTSSPSTPP